MALYLIAIVGIAAGLAVLNGWVLSILWGWFIVPTFAAPALSIPAAMGIAIAVGYMTSSTRGKDDREKWDKIATPFVHPIVALGVGWIVKQFL